MMRFTVVKFLYFSIIFLIILRLGFWQIFKSDDLSALADNQRLTTQDISGLRGDILFSDGSILASNKPAYLVFSQPKLLRQKHQNLSDSDFQIFLKNYCQKIAGVLVENDHQGQNLNQETIFEMTKSTTDELYGKVKKDLNWVSLGRKVDTEVKKQLEDLKLEDLGFDQTLLRFYPEGSSSAHLLGFVAGDVYGNDKGYFGLEGFYDGELKGRKGQVTLEKDAQGLPILIGRFLSKEPKDGKTLVSNIDKTVQYIVEQKLKAGLEKYGAKGASAIVMDPSNGNILAMASFPSYDPADITKYPKEVYRNPIAADSYEPGSTFKVLVMAAGINEDLVKEDTKCDDCSGPINLAGFTIRTWNNEYRPNLTMTDTIIHSDNTGMVFVGKRLGIEKMYNYIEKFGFGQVTKVDLQDEQSPDLRNFKTWKEIDLATASFGQGISVTAIQVVRAVSTIANGGNLMEPHIISLIKDEKGVYKIKPRIIEKPIKGQTTKTITQMMVKAVDEGEAQFYKKSAGLSHYKIAGKTGTAQIPVAGHYDASKTIASFVGFAPADNPKFAMLVRYDQPTASIYGAETAAPTFFDIAKELFLYYGIPPNE